MFILSINFTGFAVCANLPLQLRNVLHPCIGCFCLGRYTIEFLNCCVTSSFQFSEVGQTIFLQVHDRLCHLLEIENLRPPLKPWRVGLLHLSLNINKQMLGCKFAWLPGNRFARSVGGPPYQPGRRRSRPLCSPLPGRTAPRPHSPLNLCNKRVHGFPDLRVNHAESLSNRSLVKVGGGHFSSSRHRMVGPLRAPGKGGCHGT